MTDIFATFSGARFQYNLHGLLNVAAGLFDIAVGLIVLSSNSKSKLNRSFFFLTLATSIWVLSFGLQNLLVLNANLLIFQSLGYLGGVPFIPTCFYIFSSTWAGKQHKPWVLWTWIAWSVLAMLPTVLYPDKVFGLSYHVCGIYPTYTTTPFGLTYTVFLVTPFLLNAVLTFRNILHGMRSARSPREKTQFRNFLFGFVIAYLGMGDFAAAVGVPIYPLGYFYLSIFIGIIAYSIIRHQIFEINILVRKFAVVTLIYAVLIAAMLPLSFLFQGLADRQQLPHLIGLSALFGFFLSMGPLIYTYLERHAFWLKKNVTTGLAHELKSPIGGIRGALDLILDRIDGPGLDMANVKDYLQMIDRNTNRLETYVKDLLHVARGQDEAPRIETASLNFSTLINETVDMHRSAALQRGVEIRTSLPEDLNIEGEWEKVKQIVSNVLSNAIKFTWNGHVAIEAKRDENQIICSVQDSGKGIPTADLEKIFERFYQGKNTHKGSGIGLTIAKAWVEAHGGKIWAESEGEGRGTKVTFTLPT